MKTLPDEQSNKSAILLTPYTAHPTMAFTSTDIFVCICVCLVCIFSIAHVTLFPNYRFVLCEGQTLHFLSIFKRGHNNSVPIFCSQIV